MEKQFDYSRAKELTVEAEYVVDGDTLTVSSVFYGHRSTQLEGRPPESVARALLGELISGNKA